MNGFRNFSPRASAGLSLVELMISITLVTIILAGVVKLYGDSHRSFLTNEGVARTQEGIRYVLDHISRSAARAGYMGCAQFIANPDPSDPLGTSNIENLVDVTTQTGRLYDFDTGPVFGTNDDGLNNTDTLILRSARAADGIVVESISPVTVDGAELQSSGIDKGDVVVLSDCKNIKIFMMTNDASASGVIEHAAVKIEDISNTRALFDGQENINQDQESVATLFPATGASVAYTINTSATAAAAGNACGAASPQSCALFANGQELLEGVEDLQVLYGQQSGSNVRYRRADQVTDWQGVVSVQVTITLNSVDNAFIRQEGVANGGDGRVRKTVTHVVALRNGSI